MSKILSDGDKRKKDIPDTEKNECKSTQVREDHQMIGKINSVWPEGRRLRERNVRGCRYTGSQAMGLRLC